MSDKITQLLALLQKGDQRALARAISLVESGLEGAAPLLRQLKGTTQTRVVGITGPPGAGKSTLVSGLLKQWTDAGLRVGVVAVDPSSPFHFGALLGDRIRMAEFYTHPQVFIRSLASRGALGGLHPHIIEVTDVMKEAGFDVVLVETVGVGQSEVEIAGLADCSVVALVPEAGDAVQAMKAGLLEIADIFVVNKADREGADTMVRNLKILAHEQSRDGVETPVYATTAVDGTGLEQLAAAILQSLETASRNDERRLQLLTEKTLQLIRLMRLKDVSRGMVFKMLKTASAAEHFNLYSFAADVATNSTVTVGAQL